MSVGNSTRLEPRQGGNTILPRETRHHVKQQNLVITAAWQEGIDSEEEVDIPRILEQRYYQLVAGELRSTTQFMTSYCTLLFLSVEGNQYTPK